MVLLGSPPTTLAKRSLLVTGCVAVVAALCMAFWVGRSVLLLVFAGMLFSVVLSAVTQFLADKLHLRRPWALGLTLLLLIAIGAAAIYLLGTRLSAEAGQITQQLPVLIGQIQAKLGQYAFGRSVIEHMPSVSDLLSRGSGILQQVSIAFSGLLGVIGNIVIIFFVGLYLAADPHSYRDGLLRLVPVPARPRFGAAFDAVGQSLGRWLLGKLALMTFVGVFTALGLWLLKIPLVLSLALLAAALDFIPNIGPVASSVPALLLALLQSPVHALWVGSLYVAVQFLESYILAPLVQRRAVSLPPALLIGAQVLLAVILGLPGLILATPLTVMILVLVRKLYIEGFLEGRKID